MSEITLPDGQYFALSGRIHPRSGGQTRALLMRNRLFAEWSGIEPTLLSFDETPEYPEIRKTLRTQGQLIDGTRLLNIYEWYRDNSVDQLEPTGESLPVAEGLDALDIPHPDGGLYQTKYKHRHLGDVVFVDYRRADGSVYLRAPTGNATATSVATKVILVNSKGQPVRSWPNRVAWRRYWITSLIEPKQRAFLICDSRFALAGLLPIEDERLHVLHLIHNIHLAEPYDWSSAVNRQYLPVFKSIPYLDGLVTLTDRQREDVADRFGATENMYVVPNPVESPPLPDPLPGRDGKRFAMVGRLEQQKRMEDAIRAFALVLKEEPEAKLDIYGDGRLEIFLNNEIETLGIQDSVALRGHDPNARDALWTATALLLTSRFEGYPLATLESMSHGCPVISYDIKYGPKEQISDGVDGFLIEPGDLQGMADRIVQLIRNPELAAKLSDAALDKARHHDHGSFLDNWRKVLEAVIAKRPYRTELTSARLTVSRLGYLRSQRLPDRFGKTRFLKRLAGRRSSSAGFRAAPRMEFVGRLKVQGQSERGSLDDVKLTLTAIGEKSGSTVTLPLQVKRSGQRFDLSSHFDPAHLFDAATSDTRALRLRLRLVWHNSSWETILARPRRLAPNYELSYADDGRLTLQRGPQAPGAS
jgi:poly(glycerol-phosphate) alpha-glucosyltransferase